jgi:5'-AMP-activated protein kinase regulatory beta subunit
MKFIVDDSWRCSKQIPTATDDDGTLVNWIEVEPAKTEEELKAEWAMDAKPPSKQEDGMSPPNYQADKVEDEGQWTNIIPAPIVAYQYIEELPNQTDPTVFNTFLNTVPYLSVVPQPPTLPRILDKVIVNAEPKRRHDEGGHTPAGLDDNSILAVPNHVVLNHLTASAIKNGTLGVGTTTRYRKKVCDLSLRGGILADKNST